MTLHPRPAETSDEHELLGRMSDLSEDIYAAGWLSGLEDDLWDRLNGRPASGFDLVTDEQAAHLRHLAELTGCWGVWSDELDSEAVVTLDEWKASRP